MTVRRLGIVGSGTMATGIAECAAAKGLEVVIRSRTREAAGSVQAALARSLARRVEKGKLADGERRVILDRISLTCDLAELGACDLVIESIVEDWEAKRHLFRQLDRVCAEPTVLATNTSTLPVVDLAVETRRPERVCGVHFFNPAPVMPLVEIVRPLTVADDTIAQARGFVEALGKTAVVVKDQAGFVVNALLFPYLNNAVRLLESGVAPMADIDEAMKGACAFPMGPLALLDLVGLDTSLAILDALHQEYGDPNYAPVPLLRRMVAAGRLGRKSGRGFYDYAER